MKGQGLPISTIIIAALGILVLVVIGAIFGSQISKFGKAASECQGRCYKASPPVGVMPGVFDPNKCNADFETKLSGAWIPKSMPSKVDNPGEWRCDECCILTG
ncbi:MAG: hypothetical protein NTW67_00345 [Candidatus Woesearchaeota archaeon]|nr:hypothetical protein [Candidatus Woesearchaeota archaeon]